MSSTKNKDKKNTSTIEVSNLFSPVLLENNEQWAHTQSKLYKVNFTWTIDNYSFRQEKIGERLESPKFFSHANHEINWHLEIYPNGENEEVKDYLAIFLTLVSEPLDKSKTLGKFQFSILNVEPSKTLKTSFFDARHFELYQSWGHKDFFKRSFILDKANGFLPNDKLTIVCRVSFVSGSNDISSQKSIGQFKVPECKIADDLGKLLDSQELSDITLVVGKYEFPAHKAILAARSDVFSAMFKYDMIESRSGRIDIIDVNKEVLEEMLHFIYTGEAPKLKQMANQLLTAADKYALKKLKVMCEEVLFAELTIESATETLILADFHNAYQLKEQTKKFISNHAKEIIQTKGWQNMMNTNAHSTLLAETLEALITPIKATSTNSMITSKNYQSH